MKQTLLLGMLLIYGAACGYPPKKTPAPRLTPRMTEDQIFDVTYQPPVALLQQLYEEHQLLVLAFEEHDNERQYRALTALLGQVGRDPRLRYVILERFIENGPILETASLTPLDEFQLKDRLEQQFPDRPLPAPYHGSERDNARWSLCGSEWAFTWAEVMPHIRALNATRPARHKLRVTTVDGVSSAMRAGKWGDSYERDSTTAVLFHDRIWQKLRHDPAAKVIIVYNIGHTVQGFTLVQGDSTVPPTFLDMFLHQHPEARPRTAIVMVEGLEEGKEVAFRFTQRQVARKPDRSFGVRMAPFRGVALERGDSVLTAKEWAVRMGPRTSARKGVGHIGQSTATLPEMVDAIVWLPASEQHATKDGSTYLPEVCTE